MKIWFIKFDEENNDATETCNINRYIKRDTNIVKICL